MADASAVDYENFGDGEMDQGEYQDGQQGFEEEGYQGYPQMDYGNYMPNGQLANGQVPNGHIHNGQMPMFSPQGIRSDGQARQFLVLWNDFQHKPSRKIPMGGETSKIFSVHPDSWEKDPI